MQNVHKPHGPYECFIKRPLDFMLSLTALLVLLPLLLILTIFGAIKMKGNPFFVQKRPGRIDKRTGQEKIFSLIKFRTMSNEKDADGKLLPDAERLNGYGRFLRSTSLDELPELVNIVKGDMAIVGPRPQLVRDMVFMTPDQRKRHAVRQGLTGLAQVSGRNNMRWEKKFEYDLEYIKSITFIGDLKIILKTVVKVFVHEGINEEGMATAEDLGEYLLRNNIIDIQNYERRQHDAIKLLKETSEKKITEAVLEK